MIEPEDPFRRWLRELGYPPSKAPPDDDDTPVEPREITGNGPEGSPYGLGRGELDENDRCRLIFFCTVVREGRS